MSKCIECNIELVWGGDHTYEDYGLEGEGIVSNYSCIDESCPSRNGFSIFKSVKKCRLT